MPICSVITCKYGTEDQEHEEEGIVFHPFPKNEESRARWVDMTGRDDWEPTTEDRVCSRHFRDSDYIIKRSGKKYLKIAAIPCEYVVYRLFSDEDMAPIKEEIKIEVQEEEPGAQVDEFEEVPDPHELFEIPEIPDDQPGPSSGFVSLPVPSFGSPFNLPEFPDSTINNNDGNSSSMAHEWNRGRSYYSGLTPVQSANPFSIFDNEENQHAIDSSGLRDRSDFPCDFRALMNPYPPLDMEELPLPKTPDPVVAIETETDDSVDQEIEQMQVSESAPSQRRCRQKLQDIKKIMTRRKGSKKAIAAANAEVREAREIQIKLKQGIMTDYDKAAAIIALQHWRIVKLAMRNRRYKKILKRISTVL